MVVRNNLEIKFELDGFIYLHTTQTDRASPGKNIYETQKEIEWNQGTQLITICLRDLTTNFFILNKPAH